MKKTILTTISVLIFCVVGQTAEQSIMPSPRPVSQVSEFKPHIGVMIGAAQPEGSGITASEFGMDIGYQPYIPFGVAAELTHARIDDGTETVDRNTLWLKGTYNFGGTVQVLKESYVGLALGSVFKPDSTSLAVAPMLGFDIPVTATAEGVFSLGANLRYAIVGDDEVDTLTLGGVLKYWY
ncbi:MAG: hypothetical protein JNL11_05770 [Bdellovibrionaceae bacterium]|nr:hypothetical protein [Pseudobdellovibrionaceae bacterium]